MFKYEESKEKISKLVEDFDHKKNLIKSDLYKEANVEDEFIKPLFRYLNWNISNEGIQNIANREFIVQAKGKNGKEPDYLLQTEGKPWFYIEAKHPKYDLFKEIRYIWQAYSYAYSTQSSAARFKVDFSLLTDFEEFRLFDCTYAAKPETVNNYSSLNWLYSDYVDKFKDLWNIFEKNNVKNGSLTDLYLTDQKLKANKMPPDVAFLKDLDDPSDGWRVYLAKDIKKNNNLLDSDFITRAVQIIIDRLIFLKVLSDREIEDDFLQEIIIQTKEQKNTTPLIVFDKCKETFKKLNKTYNGSIFEERREINEIILSNNALWKILTDFLPQNSRYNFKQIPVEVLGTIYEQFLGKTIKATDKRLSLEDKPEVRNAGGVFYTPQWIVDYIVKHSLNHHLKNCKSIDDLFKLKICDPTCGSGSFLLGAYNELLDWAKTYYENKNLNISSLTKAQKEHVYIDSAGNVRLTSKLRREILKNSIYGVDIDQQAVELAKTSLSLKALEGTKHDELYQEVTLFNESVLPTLTNNLKCGNSIISTDIYNNKLDIAKEEDKKLNPLSWEDEFSEVFQKGGFDVIIGNPPWGASISDTGINYLKEKYSEVIERMIDTYIYVTYRSLQLVKKDSGVVGMIIPSTFLNQSDTIKLRESLLKDRLSHIISLGQGIFGNKVLNTSTIVIFNHNHNHPNIFLSDLSKHTLLEKQEMLLSEDGERIKFKDWEDLVNTDIHKTFFVSKLKHISLLQKIQKDNLPLNEFIINNIERGVSPDIAEAFVVSNHTVKEKKLEADLLKPSISGTQIKRFKNFTIDQNIIYTDRNTQIERFPNIRDHLKGYKNQITCREVLEKKHPWYSLHRPRKLEIFQSPKIIGLTTSKRIELVFDKSDNLVVTDAMYIIHLKDNIDPILFISFMQSKVVHFCYLILNQGESRVIPQIKATKLYSLTIPDLIKISKSELGKKITETYIAIHEESNLPDHSDRKINYLKSELENLIFESYNIRDIEKDIILEIVDV